jgi:hypothetical protein
LSGKSRIHDGLVRLARAGGAAVLLLALGTAAASHAVRNALAIGAGVRKDFGVRQALPGADRVPWGEAWRSRESQRVRVVGVPGWLCRASRNGPARSPWVCRVAVPALVFWMWRLSWMRERSNRWSRPASGGGRILRLVPADYLVTVGRGAARRRRSGGLAGVFLAAIGLPRCRVPRGCSRRQADGWPRW